MTMNNSITILFSLIVVMTRCSDGNSNKRQTNTDNRLLEDTEHYIKDSPPILKHDSTILYTGWYYVIDTTNGFKRQLDKSAETYLLDPKPIVTAKNVISFDIYESNYNGKKYFGLTMRLDKEGTENWSFATGKAEITGMRLAFILDNRLLQVAKVNSQITGGVTALNRGDYSKEELENFRAIIQSER
jgi:hypothetical protein